MDSAIHIDSVMGQGTTFFFEFIAETEAAKGRDAGELSHLERCLIVDDNASSRGILERLLTGWDIACESCDNGLTAVKIVETSGRFDVIICDRHMPSLDGLATIRLMAEKQRLTRDRPAVILLNFPAVDPELQSECDALGVRFCITKPVKQEQLFTCLASLRENPAAKAGERGEQAGTYQDSGSSPGPVPNDFSVLVAEDVPANMLLTTALLKLLKPGIEVIQAKNGEIAVQKYRERTPDLILMDVQMPEMDGLDATKAIRELERVSGGHVPIFALTAGAIKEEMERCREAGMDDFLTKPIEVETLRKAIASCSKVRKSQKDSCSSSGDTLRNS